jgi:rubredoxin-NAD+ reductase
MEPIIIIGTGLAGYQLAREYRKLDQTTPLMLVTSGDGRFYSKPLLSTALTNKKDLDTLTTGTAESMSAQLNASIRTNTDVSAIHPHKKTIVMNDEEITYSKLVLASGAVVVKPHLQHEVVSVNHLEEYDSFQKLLQNKKNITILGAGLIGCEFANDLSNAGYNVHVVALGKSPLDLLMPESIGKLLQKSLEENNVHFHFDCTVTHVDKMAQGYHLTLSNGETLDSELVLSAIGLKPNVTLAQAADIKINRGIIVNRYLETSCQDIYALGDCAEVEGHVLPFITPLLNAARALAKTLAAEKTAVDYPAMPVLVKTPAHPIAVCPPPKNMEGAWKIEIENNNVRALFYNEANQLYGFVLTNEAVKERMNLAKQIPALF